jgi:hypothetical protein
MRQLPVDPKRKLPIPFMNMRQDTIIYAYDDEGKIVYPANG